MRPGGALGRWDVAWAHQTAYISNTEAAIRMSTRTAITKHPTSSVLRPAKPPPETRQLVEGRRTLHPRVFFDTMARVSPPRGAHPIIQTDGVLGRGRFGSVRAPRPLSRFPNARATRRSVTATLRGPAQAAPNQARSMWRAGIPAPGALVGPDVVMLGAVCASAARPQFRSRPTIPELPRETCHRPGLASIDVHEL